MGKNRDIRPLPAAAGTTRTGYILLVQMSRKINANKPGPGSRASSSRCCAGKNSLLFIEIFRTRTEGVPKPGREGFPGHCRDHQKTPRHVQSFSAVSVHGWGHCLVSRKRCRRPAAAYVMSGINVRFSRCRSTLGMLLLFFSPTRMFLEQRVEGPRQCRTFASVLEVENRATWELESAMPPRH